jgi:AcrR family transcriptional regulator
MTLKRKEILNCSIKLFAAQGVKETSTKQIAHEAKVSEGLIFRHFHNKKGLVKAVIHSAFDRIAPYIEEVLQINCPATVIKTMIHLPFKLLKDEPTYWRLQMSIKFQQSLEDLKEDCDNHSPALFKKVSWALQELGFNNPDMEAQMFHMLFEGIVHRAILEGTDKNLIEFTRFLEHKYKLNAVQVS